MLNSELAANLSLAPKNFRRDFDAHIYYSDDASRAEAEALRLKAQKEFEDQPILVGDLVDRPVGPHPTPMFEINCRKEDRLYLYDWLNLHRGNLNILLHAVTGYDVRDHELGAVWLGHRVPLDPRKLDSDPQH